MTDDGADRGKEPVGALNAGKRGQGRGLGLGGILRGQAVALLDVEHRIAFEEWDFPDLLLAIVACLGAGDFIGIDDKLAMLALANSATQFKRLHEGEP